MSSPSPLIFFFSIIIFITVTLIIIMVAVKVICPYFHLSFFFFLQEASALSFPLFYKFSFTSFLAVEEPLEIHELAKNLRLPAAHTKRTLLLSDIAEALVNSHQEDKARCSRNSTTDFISVCIHFKKTTTSSRVDVDFYCVKISTKRDNQLNGDEKASYIPSPFLFSSCLLFFVEKYF